MQVGKYASHVVVTRQVRRCMWIVSTKLTTMVQLWHGNVTKKINSLSTHTHTHTPLPISLLLTISKCFLLSTCGHVEEKEEAKACDNQPTHITQMLRAFPIYIVYSSHHGTCTIRRWRRRRSMRAMYSLTHRL